MDDKHKESDDNSNHDEANDHTSDDTTSDNTTEEIGGSNKPDPVRYGDWEIGGKCVDF